MLSVQSVMKRSSLLTTLNRTLTFLSNICAATFAAHTCMMQLISRNNLFLINLLFFFKFNLLFNLCFICEISTLSWRSSLLE